MLSFQSASTRMVNSSRAMTECLEAALGTPDPDCDLILFSASIGHDYLELARTARELAPSARVLGASCCGIVGSEGVSESMKDLAVMTVRGKDQLAIGHVTDVRGHNAREKAVELATQIREAHPETNMVYLMGPGIDTDNNALIAGIESVLGPEVTIFGATTSDNMRGLTNHQVIDEELHQHSAWAVGFADPSLVVETQATHGFVAIGEPLEVTAAEGNRIIEFNGQPAWHEYTRRLGLEATAKCGDTIPIGALAEELPPDLAEEYGNPHILRVVTSFEPDGAMHYATGITSGTKLWLTVRDEDRIFNDMDRMMEQMVARSGDRETVAVFHADCLARGRFMFNRVMKEELVGRMQHPLSTSEGVPPWLGMYGFGEFARLGGQNTYHNYTTAIYAIQRSPES
jgi:hypothetical protein